MSLLDVGCGELWYIFKQRWGERYFGLEVDSHGVTPDYSGDACELAFDDNSFDVITGWSVLEHVRHPFDMLAEMVRVSRGTALITTDLTPRDKNCDDSHLYSWTPKTLTQLVSQVHGDSNVYTANGMIVAAMYRCGDDEVL